MWIAIRRLGLAVCAVGLLLTNLRLESQVLGAETKKDADRKAIAPIEIRGQVVDEKGTGVSKVTLRMWELKEIRDVRVDADGRFRVELKKLDRPLRIVMFVASDATGKLQVGTSIVIRKKQPIDEIKLTMRAAIEVPVVVLDKKGAGLHGVPVYAATIYQEHLPLGKTDEQGKLTARLPTGLSMQAIWAALPGTGLDYFPSGTRREPNFEWRKALREGGTITLKLVGVKPLRVRVLDSKERPLVGVELYPRQFTRPAKGDDLPLYAFFRQVTDERGVAEFSVIPADNMGEIEFSGLRSKPGAGADEKKAFDQWSYDPVSGKDEVTFHWQAPSDVAVHGVVIQQNGQPAAGAKVTICGRGAEGEFFDDVVTSNAQGKFEANLKGEQYCIFVASKDRLASKGHLEVIHSDRAVPQIMLTLIPATRVFGKVTLGPDRKPQVGSYVNLYQRDGDNYHKLPEAQKLPPKKKTSRRSNRGGSPLYPMLRRTLQVDDQGQFEFLVGPGRYYMYGPQGIVPPNFEITTEKEHEVNFHVERPAYFEATGRVSLLRDRRRGVGKAKVTQHSKKEGIYASPVVSGLDGKFKMKRGDGVSVFQAVSADGLLIGNVEVKADQTELRIPVAPATAVHGRVVHDVTKRPIGGMQVYASIRITFANGLMQDAFEQQAVTNSLGEFTLRGLAAGCKYQLSMAATMDEHGHRYAGTMGQEIRTSERGGTKLGDVAYAPHSSMKLEDRIQRVMPLLAAPAERLQGAKREARIAGQQILLIGGSRNGPVVRRFFEIYFGETPDPELVRRGLANFQILAVDTTEGPGRNVSKPFFEQWNLPLPAADGAVFAILDADGKKVAVAELAEMSTDGKLSGTKLYALLKKYFPTFPDAEESLTTALATSKREDKRVVVHLIHRDDVLDLLMTRFLEKSRKVLEPDYVLLEIDERAPNWDVVLKPLPKDKHGVPASLTVLDAEGKVLAESDDTTSGDGNFAFPILPTEIQQLEQMFKATAPRLKQEDLEGLVKELKTWNE